MTRRALPSLLVAIAIVVAAVALLAPNHGQAIDPVAQAAATTVGVGSAEFGLSGNISVAGQTIPMKGNGAIDMRRRAAHMTMSTSIPPMGDVAIEEILDGTTIYMKMPQLAQLPGGKPWAKIDLQKAGKAAGIDFSKLMQNGQTNPADMLGYLKGVGSSKKVGTESIRGAVTTHYRSQIDLKKAADKLGDKKTADSMKQLFSQSGVSSFPVDVWIDRSGRVRRESMSMKFGGAVGGAMDMTIEFTRFGVPVDTTPPPADQVNDLSSLMSGALGG